jgi:hypothetical protein
MTCVLCGISGNILDNNWLNNYYGLLPNNNKIVLRQASYNNFLTNNNIEFIPYKKMWNITNSNKCYGCLIHKDCFDLINKHYNIIITFNLIAPYINNNTNLLKEIDYKIPINLDIHEQKFPFVSKIENNDIKSNSSYDKFYLLNPNKNLKNKNRILQIWNDFNNYKKNIIQRKLFFNNIKKQRYIIYNNNNYNNYKFLTSDQNKNNIILSNNNIQINPQINSQFNNKSKYINKKLILNLDNNPKNNSSNYGFINDIYNKIKLKVGQ